MCKMKNIQVWGAAGELEDRFDEEWRVLQEKNSLLKGSCTLAFNRGKMRMSKFKFDSIVQGIVQWLGIH